MRFLLFAAVLSFATSAASDDCALSPAQRGNLVRCAAGIVGPLVGYRGSFALHMKTTADFRMIVRIDDGPPRDVQAPACMAVAHERPSCGWRVTGPSPAWRVTPE